MSDKEKRCAGKTIAVYAWTAFSGLEVKGIEYGVEDYVYCTTSDGKCHKLRIRETAHGDPYFILYGKRVPLGDCVRV